MIAALIVTLVLVPCLWAGSDTAPSYSAASIGNSATYAPDALAPNTLASIFGLHLSWSTRALSLQDISHGTLPTELAGVRVFVAGLPAPLYYVSAEQVNFLIPGSLRPGEMDLWLTRDGTAGPTVRITLLEAAPALFRADSDTAIATRPDGSLLTPEAAGHPGEVVVLYAAGLGRTEPDRIDGQITFLALPLRRLSEFSVWIGGEALDHAAILYAGAAPGFPGLYQINFKLPEQFAPDPEIRIAVGDQMSPPGVKLPAR